MKNREKYIAKHNEYDLMTAIERNTGCCPIRAVAGISREEKIVRCAVALRRSDAHMAGYDPDAACKHCVQRWLNEEARR